MKIASIENLELLLSPYRKRYMFGRVPGSTLEGVIRASVPAAHSFVVEGVSKVPLYMNDLEVIRASHAISQCQSRHGTHLFLGNVSDRWIWSACRRAGISLICNEAAQQERFENKIFFHRLMERYGVPVPEGKVVTSLASLEKGMNNLYVKMVKYL